MAALVLIASLAWAGRDLATVGRGLVGRDHRAEQWQRWVAHHDRLFGMLHEGSRVGLQERGELGVGIVVERAADGIVARRTLHLASERPPVVLVVETATADALLGSTDGDPDAIWQVLKEALAEGRITLWSDPDLQRLDAGGHLAFMRAVDVRPREVGWSTVRELLEE